MLSRKLQQQLRSLQRAGLTHLPKSHRTAATAPAAPESLPAVPQSKAAPHNAAPPAQSPVHVIPADESEPMKRKPDTEKPLIPALASPQAPPTVPLSLDARKTQLAELTARVAQCRRCDELATTRTQTVFGVGNPEARVLFIGEAPGADEDIQGEPFVGRAGQLLDKIIEASQLKREEIYICNILKCRPPGNRTPLPDECTNCREFLDGQLRIIDPEFIVCWGAVAAQNLLGSTFSIGKLRRRFFQHGRAKVLCTYHPSYLLRNPAAKKDVWDDMKLLMAELGLTPPA